ncbi:PREDICTED: amyotrophic lateral sclerosis 2 chromosomal region candidate gene 12 protein isoform X2 [Chinchilla lanigera]|uniref:amyotrophic lateral sclerosis 2 chromosomal region candidate gene 12 protein isoform X2 n=1 Tax=Chinchilla lanigera TaxID=34839 RepID=UPI0006973D43|nr:PREDICTED: amyotrophic lateral sclerosis 2 chromosomal region candidate gene 12 protein isoform X2 [Chinchilla lanigera]
MEGSPPALDRVSPVSQKAPKQRREPWTHPTHRSAGPLTTPVTSPGSTVQKSDQAELKVHTQRSSMTAEKGEGQLQPGLGVFMGTGGLEIRRACASVGRGVGLQMEGALFLPEGCAPRHSMPHGRTASHCPAGTCSSRRSHTRHGESVHPGRQEESHKSPHEVIDVSPGYQLVRNRERISVTLGDEMFSGEKQYYPEGADRVDIPRASIICDLEEQILELTTIIEQMNRDHQAARRLLCDEMEQRCDIMKRNFENKTRELRVAHKEELSELENNYREALKAEKSAAQGKLEEMQKEYKYLRNMFYLYQDTIHDEMEDKWSKRKAEWEEDEKMEREKILLQQKYKMTKKFELESEEEKRRMSESYSATFESFVREKEELLRQHERDAVQLQELRKTKEIIEEELHAQALILESLNTNLYQTQLELQKEKAAVGNLEKVLQNKLAEVEEKYKYTIQNLTEENSHLRSTFLRVWYFPR